MGFGESLQKYLMMAVSGLAVLVMLLKDCVVYGFREVLGNPTFQKPTELLEDPALGTHGYLHTSKGVRIHYVASGSEDRPLMLFLHGFPDFWFSWRHQIHEFQKDYRVVAIDQRGYGDSDRPPGVTSYSTDHLMTDVRDVIRWLGHKSCILVAHDWGGLVAWAFAANFPDMVDRLAVLNAPALPVFKKVIDTDKEQFKMSSFIFLFQLPYLPELLLKSRHFAMMDMLGGKVINPKTNTYNLKTPLSDSVIQAYKYTFSQPGALTAPLNWYRAEGGRNFPTKHSLDYPMPCLLLWGMKDTALSPALPATMERECPRLVVKRYEDAGHFIQFEAPEFVNTTIREWIGGKA